MLNYSNIPTWGDLLKVFQFYNTSDYQKIKKVWGKYNKNIINYFSKSSWSILLIVLLKLKKKTLNIWVPSYYCEDALYLIKKFDVKINFYDVDKNFVADVLNLKKLYSDNKPDIIIFCNFFGKNCYHPYFREISTQSNSWLIEDATHCISPANNIGKYGDFVIYSPYKFFPIPTGAILTTSSKFIDQNKLEILLSEKKQNLFLKKYFDKLKFKKKNNFFHNLIWSLKKIIFKLKFNFNRIKEFNEDEKINSVDYFWNPKLDYYSKNILDKYAGNIEKEKEKRLRMLILWKTLFQRYEYVKKLDFDLSFIQNNHIPYFAIIKDNELNIENKYKFLKKKNIPLLTWPNLPEEILRKSCSHDLRKNFFFLPLHDQSLQILKLIEKLKNIKNNQLSKNISLNKINEKKIWEKYFNKISLSNISQSWHYTESQKELYNLNVDRYLISIDHTPKGIVQVLSKKFLFLSINRINRGPLFFNECDNQEKKLVLLEIFKIFNNYKKLNFLSFSPEMKFNEENILLNSKDKNFYFNLPNWKSSTIDLKKDEFELKSQLDSKWRNMLNSALKENIHVKEENNENDLDKIIRLNLKDQIDKNYKGIDSKILKSFLLRSNYKILSAYVGDQLISSICISLHGTTATYLVGWSNDLGRKKKSMNLLLWKSLLYLKNKGYNYFDLGGLDKGVSSGIYRFKNGMGGKNYKLVGNYSYLSNFRIFNL